MAKRREEIRARIRRLYVPDAIYFITCVTQNRRRVFDNDGAIVLLRQTMHEVKTFSPFGMRAYVFLPDHFHLMIHVDPATNISKVMHAIKRNFTLNFKRANGLTRAVNLWQRGFWDHVIRDGPDYTRHAHYIHFNPVKHGLVERAADYEHSSFHHYVNLGWYDRDWGRTEPEGMKELESE